MGSRPKYRPFDHTADVGLEAFGNDLRELFSNAAEGMFEILGNSRGFEPKEIRQVSLWGNGREDLLHKWLAELLFFFDTEKLFFVSFDIKSLQKTHLEAEVKGESYSGKESLLKTEIKAVTYHRFKVKKIREGYEARVVFDV